MSKIDPEEKAALKRLAIRTTDKILLAMPEGKEKDLFRSVRPYFEMGYVAGASDVLDMSQDAGVALRTGFAQGQLHAAVSAKIGGSIPEPTPRLEKIRENGQPEADRQ